MPEFIPNDPIFAQEWHLRDTTGIDTDINVTWVWPDYTGRLVNVGVYDNGVDVSNPDLNDNWNLFRRFTWQGVTQDGTSGTIDHGTAVAGIIAAEGNNGIGTTGVAYGALFTGVPIYGSTTTDSSGYRSSAYSYQTNFDVVNHSYGTSAFHAWATPGHYEYEAALFGMDQAALHGRGGLGTSVVVAAGNDRNGQGFGGGPSDANIAGWEGHAHSVIVVGGVAQDGFVSSYSNPGANLLVVAPTSETLSSAADGIWSTDVVGNAGYSTTMSPSANGTDYTLFTGTSAAAPIVTGVVALMYEANPRLGWRDVREILADSARHVGSAYGAQPNSAQLEKNSWTANGAKNWNGGGHYFSEDYGFGLVDALAAVRLAETWTTQKTTTNESTIGDMNFFSGSGVVIPDPGTAQLQYHFAPGTSVEEVTLDLDFNAPHQNVTDLVILLTSPSGKTSVLLNQAGNGNTVSRMHFNANAFLGEDSGGTWTLNIVDTQDTVFDPFNTTAAGSTSIYRANLDIMGSASSPDTTYIFTNEFGAVSGDGRHAFSPIDNDGGVDTINAAAVTGDTIIDFVNGHIKIAGHEEFFTWGGSDPRSIAIENIITGDGNDIIGGNFVDNTLRGGRGNDTIDGGDGLDTAVYSGHRTDYSIIRLASGAFQVSDLRANSPDGTDTLMNVERLSFLADGKTTSLIPPAQDLNGDGFSDLLWHSKATGDIFIWDMNGSKVVSGGYVASLDANVWHSATVADFNGDHKPEILWQDSSGNLIEWTLGGTTVTGGSYIGTQNPAQWTLQATGDFNGDGKDDLLWQTKTSGDLFLWDMNGTSVSGSGGGYVATMSPAAFTLAAHGDFNGDGKTDLVWRSSAGDLFLWTMNDKTVTSSGYIGTMAPGSWALAATGDFNGDGKTDLLWQDKSNGNLFVWDMNGAKVSAGGYLATLDPNVWHVANTGDYNADGRSDLLWQDTSGNLVEWTVASNELATSVTGGGYIGTMAQSGWTLAPH